MVKPHRRTLTPVRILLAISALVALGALAAAELDRIVVVGQRVDGGALTCMSGPCFDTAQAQAAQALLEYQRMYQTFPQDELPLDAGKFCRALGAKQPANCSVGSPPPSPGIHVPGQPAYQPNACGTGWLNRLAANAALRAYSEQFSGDVDAPYPGVSFLGACNAHDTCWASGGSRGTCDSAFSTQTLGACSRLPGAAERNACNGFSNLYHSMVTNSRVSDANYEAALGKRRCSTWARDMRENGCAH